MVKAAGSAFTKTRIVPFLIDGKESTLNGSCKPEQSIYNPTDGLNIALFTYAL